MSGSVIVKVELPLDLYGKLARATNSEVGRLLRTLATRAARMESEELKSITHPTPQKPEHSYAEERAERTRERVKFIETELAKGRRVADIARDLGVTESAVCQQMKRHGLTGIPRSERLSVARTERENAIRELWSRHHRGAEIARILRMSPSLVYPIVRRLNQEDKIS